MEAQNEEELAAIRIAATAKELSEYGIGNGARRYANMLCMDAYESLRTRYALWHYAMKRLVSDKPYMIQNNRKRRHKVFCVC